MNLWTRDEINKILIQLDDMQLPFSKYTILSDEGETTVLGSGGSADVYEMISRSTNKADSALKVMGFRGQEPNSDLFKETVSAQKSAGNIEPRVVKIKDFSELWVAVDDNANVISAGKEKPEDTFQVIKLQFILMEKLQSVLERNWVGKAEVKPYDLAAGDEREILKLAYDVGLALKGAHDHHILHRDVKLENVFYSKKNKQYKLGDFGIAKRTESGFADTIAFTNGYKAPELSKADESYDCTLDIYSFGIMLYVLSNNLKFPDSKTYSPNVARQYSQGYVVPRPKGNISEEFYNIIAKACMYEPDDRYQSMQEMLHDIEKLIYKNNKLFYEKDYKSTSLVVGMFCFYMGIAAWKLICAPDLVVSFNLWVYILLIFVIIIDAFFGISFVGYFSIGALFINVISLIQQSGGLAISQSGDYTWLIVAFISVAIVMWYQYYIISINDYRVSGTIYKNSRFWKLVIALYGLVFLTGWLQEYILYRNSSYSYGNKIQDALLTIDLKWGAVCGIAFCILWMLRTRLLAYLTE